MTLSHDSLTAVLLWPVISTLEVIESNPRVVDGTGTHSKISAGHRFSALLASFQWLFVSWCNGNVHLHAKMDEAGVIGLSRYISFPFFLKIAIS
ncbi:hypothetical protein POTOM_009056 [Populus tomentosa]|uniref:Uncharacterized protein n=1 Tax=Populus tomentosa TaxID=118781 RepID=A0A8X8DCZ6_POPTO|nr:hypothetical protein POTOM_009056 [Populus tomentosa]